MLIANDTKFAALGFGDLHRDGMRMAVIAVRGRYEISSEGVIRLAHRQEIALSDVYEGNALKTPMVRTGDLIPFKPAADVTILGNAHAPDGQQAPQWKASVAVNRHAATLRIHGPRRWEPAFKLLKPSWKLGEPDPVTFVPLDYRLASGGRFAGDPDGTQDDRNPLGAGLMHRDWSPWGKPLRAPQIDSAGARVDDPFERPEPQGFGPVPPFWAWRERHLGTRDEGWQRDRCPQMPQDLSYRFFQTAHPSLVIPRLSGNETVRLSGLIKGGRSLAFTLPGVALVARHQWSDRRAIAARLTLDGLHLDLRALDGPWYADLTWRGWVVRCPAYRGATLTMTDLEAALLLPVSGEYGLDEPPSAESWT